MKLAICSVGELFGGVERHILGMCTWLKREGHEFVLILFHDRELARQAREIGVEPVVIKARNKYDFALVRELAKVLTMESIKVVHVHGYKATIVCALARRLVPFRMIKTEHGMVESSSARPLNWLKSQFNYRLEQYLTRRNAEAVCYVTQDLKDVFEPMHRGLIRKVVHNGIDPLDRTFYDRPADLPEGRINLGIVGRVSSVKGIPVALEALTGLDHIDELHLVVIGNGPLLAELVDLSEKMGLTEKVHFLGFRSETFNYLAHIDILLMPSHHEGLPYTILEAMSLGRPIIASSVGGLKEVLVQGESAILIDDGDHEGLAKAITLLSMDPAKAGKLSLVARQEQNKHFTLDHMARSYLKVLRLGDEPTSNGLGRSS